LKGRASVPAEGRRRGHQAGLNQFHHRPEHQCRRRLAYEVGGLWINIFKN
jgi:hypothetical protein